MFRTCPKSLLLLLLTAVCASAVLGFENKGNASVRGFAVYGHGSDNTDSVDLRQYVDYGPPEDIGGVLHQERSRNKTNSSKLPELSEEAHLFLTGSLSTILIPSFYTLVCVISVPINVCALLVLARRIKPKKPAAIYMLNLACADLLFALVLPFKISYHFNGNNWIFGPAMCRVVTAAFYWNMYCSVLLITCISVDRLLAVVYPIDSLAWRNPRNTSIACGAMWVFSFAGCLQVLATEQTVTLTQLNITICHDGQFSMTNRIYFIVLCCLLFFVPLLITVVSYIRVILSLTRVPKGIPGSSRKRQRAVVMALTVLVMFLICFAPTNVFLLVHQLHFTNGDKSSRDASDSFYVVYLVFLCLGSLNCLLDPLVYYFGSSQCQRELTSALRCQKITSSARFSTSDSSRSSSRTFLKSSNKESTTKSPLTKKDSLNASLSSQYKKLLA